MDYRLKAIRAETNYKTLRTVIAVGALIASAPSWLSLLAAIGLIFGTDVIVTTITVVSSMVWLFMVLAAWQSMTLLIDIADATVKASPK